MISFDLNRVKNKPKYKELEANVKKESLKIIVNSI